MTGRALGQLAVLGVLLAILSLLLVEVAALAYLAATLLLLASIQRVTPTTGHRLADPGRRTSGGAR